MSNQGKHVRLAPKHSRVVFDTNTVQAPCCECGSTKHQLSSHPNPNTPEGYLRGCLHCNTKDHSFADCKNLTFMMKISTLYYYYRECREGLCPGEWHGDPREIPDVERNYSMGMMPLSPGFALANPYGNEQNFKHSDVEGHHKLKIDLLWTSNNAWSSLGCFANPRARVNGKVLMGWISDTDNRHSTIRSRIGEQHKHQSRTAPTTIQLLNFSSVPYPNLPAPPAHPDQPPPARVEQWLDTLPQSYPGHREQSEAPSSERDGEESEVPIPEGRRERSGAPSPEPQ